MRSPPSESPKRLLSSSTSSLVSDAQMKPLSSRSQNLNFGLSYMFVIIFTIVV